MNRRTASRGYKWKVNRRPGYGNRYPTESTGIFNRLPILIRRARIGDVGHNSLLERLLNSHLFLANTHMQSSFKAFLLILCLVIMGCGRDRPESMPPTTAAVEMTLADRASSIMLRFTTGIQEIPLTRLDTAVFTLPEETSKTDQIYRLDLWVDRGVPNVAVAHFRRDNGELLRQFAQLRNVGLEASTGGRAVWQANMMPLSKRPSLGTKLEATEPPSQDANERLIEMKAIASRFSNTGAVLLPDPIYRYTASDYGVVDGGTFVFVDGTVTAILAIEASKYDGGGWQYRVNRFTSTSGEISLDDNEIRSWENYSVSPGLDTGEYVEQKIDKATNNG